MLQRLELNGDLDGGVCSKINIYNRCSSELASSLFGVAELWQ